MSPLPLWVPGFRKKPITFGHHPTLSLAPAPRRDRERGRQPGRCFFRFYYMVMQTQLRGAPRGVRQRP